MMIVTLASCCCSSCWQWTIAKTASVYQHDMHVLKLQYTSGFRVTLCMRDAVPFHFFYLFGHLRLERCQWYSNIQLEDLCIHLHDICLQNDRNTQNDWPICRGNCCPHPKGSWPSVDESPEKSPKLITKRDKKGCFPKLINESSMTTYEILWIL
jgi:hypothetical protein